MAGEFNKGNNSNKRLQGLNLPPLPPMIKKLDAWVGIDPGSQGAIAILDEEGNYQVHDYNDKQALDILVEAAKTFNIRFAVLEQASTRPVESRKAVLTNGRNWGIWEGALISLKIPHVIVRPEAWQAKTVCKADGRTAKARAMAAAKRLFPRAELHGPKGGKRDGRADALLIVWYCQERDLRRNRGE